MEDNLIKFGDLAYYDSKIKEYIENNVPSNPIRVTHGELVEMRDNNLLVAGQWYQITDFYTTTCQPHTRSIGVRYDILLMAISENKFAVDAITAPHDFHVDATTHLSSEINPFTGVAYSQRDDAVNSTTVDGVWEFPDTGSYAGYCIKYYIDGKSFKGDDSALDGHWYPYYWYGTEKFIWVTSDGGTTKKRYQYVGSQDINGTTYYEWSAYNQVYTLSATPSANDTLYDSTGTAISDTLMKYIELAPKGIIVYMEDNYNNKIDYDFHSIQYERDADYIAISGTISYDNVFTQPCLTATDGYYWTFNIWYSSKLFDASQFTMTFTSGSYRKYVLAQDNIISAYYKFTWGNAATSAHGGFNWLPNNIMFSSLTYGGMSGSSHSEYECLKRNKFGKLVNDNTFGLCYNNMLEALCTNIIAASFCYNTSFSDIRNVYLKTCEGNLFKNRSSNNIKGNSLFNCALLRYYCFKLNLGEYDNDGTKTGYSLMNSITYRLYDVHIDGGSLSQCIINSLGYTDVTIIKDGTNSPSDVTIDYVNGSLNERKAITIDATSYINGVHISTNSNGDIVQWNPADLATPMSATQVNNIINQI